MLDDDTRESVDQALRAWRQGDCVLGEQWFLFRTSPSAPLTKDAAAAASQGSENVESRVFGFTVLTQTCDLVRDQSRRPFLEVCPLVKVDKEKLREIERGRRPSYAYLPGVSDWLLVADLDRVMTIEKSVLRDWERVAGCRDDAEARRLALALSRKRARVAFPNDFVEWVAPLQRRLSSKHDKHSIEGRALRALREIRVSAAPSWEAEEVSLMFWFIRAAGEPDYLGKSWQEMLSQWLGRLEASGRFVDRSGVVQTLDDLTARDYVESDPLDLDYLSSRGGGKSE